MNDLPAAGAVADDPPILIVTRFSLLGRSGWKSEASRDPSLLFAPERLRLRLALFSQITLPSLAAQQDRGFHHLVLTSRDLPPWALDGLRAACAAASPDPARWTIRLCRPRPARASLRLFMAEAFARPVVAQVALDDDDGLAADFVASLRRAIRAAGTAPEAPRFLSHPVGFGLVLGEGGAPARLYRHRYPWINLGLTMLGPPGGKNLFAINHRRAPRRLGGELLDRAPMWVRTLHPANDSRVEVSPRWRALPAWRADPDIAQRFPWLLSAGTLWA